MDSGQSDHINLCSASAHLAAGLHTCLSGGSDAYRGQICPSSVHSAAPAGAWQNLVAQHTDRGRGGEDRSLLSLAKVLLDDLVCWAFPCIWIALSSIFSSLFFCLYWPLPLTFWAKSRSPCDFWVWLIGFVSSKLMWAALVPLSDLYVCSSVSLSAKPSQVHRDLGLSDPLSSVALAPPVPPMMTEEELSVRKTSVSSSACSESLKKGLSLGLRESNEGWEEVLPWDCIAVGAAAEVRVIMTVSLA